MNTGYAPGRKSPPAIFGRQCSFSIGNEGRPELRRCSEAQRAARRGGPSGFGLVSFSGHEATNIRSVVGGEDRIDAIGLVDSAERREDYGQIYLAGGSTGNRAEWERCGKNQLCLAAAPFHCRNQGETVQTAALCGCVPCIGEGKLPDAESIGASLPSDRCRQVGRANHWSNGDAVQPRRKAASIGIGDHDLVGSGIQLYWKQDRHRRIEGAAVHYQGGRWAVVGGDIEGPRAAGGVVDLELIRARLCNRDVRKRNSVLAAVAVVSHIGSARAEAAAADAGRATELCRLRLVGREIRSDRTSVTGDDDAIEIRRVGSRIAEGDRIVTCKQGDRYGGGLRQVKAASPHVQRRRVGSVHDVHESPRSLCHRVNFHAVGSSLVYVDIEGRVIGGGGRPKIAQLRPTGTGGARRDIRGATERCGLCFIDLAGGCRNRTEGGNLQQA